MNQTSNADGDCFVFDPPIGYGGMCPEQYDVYYKGENVAYMRLRHGTFRVEVKGVIVYEADTDGDGSFMQHERKKFIIEGLRAIDRKIDTQSKRVDRNSPKRQYNIN